MLAVRKHAAVECIWELLTKERDVRLSVNTHLEHTNGHIGFLVIIPSLSPLRRTNELFLTPKAPVAVRHALLHDRVADLAPVNVQATR